MQELEQFAELRLPKVIVSMFKLNFPLSKGLD